MMHRGPLAILPTYGNEDLKSSPPDARLWSSSCPSPEQLQHGRDRAFHHDSPHDVFHGRLAVHAGLADGSAHRNFRRSDLERTGGGVARLRRQLPFSSRGLRPSKLGSPDGFPFHLAIRCEWASGNRIRDDWIRKLFHLPLAGIEWSRPAIRRRGRRPWGFVSLMPADDIPAQGYHRSLGGHGTRDGDHHRRWFFPLPCT